MHDDECSRAPAQCTTSTRSIALWKRLLAHAMFLRQWPEAGTSGNAKCRCNPRPAPFLPRLIDTRRLIGIGLVLSTSHRVASALHNARNAERTQRGQRTPRGHVQQDGDCVPREPDQPQAHRLGRRGHCRPRFACCRLRLRCARKVVGIIEWAWRCVVVAYHRDECPMTAMPHDCHAS